MKRKRIIAFLLAGLMAISGCTAGGTADSSVSNTSASESSTVTAGNSDKEESSVSQESSADVKEFTQRDLEASYDTASAVSIELQGDTASASSNAVQISEGTVTITEEGTYIISGTLKEGMIIVEASETDKVQIVLNGVEITSASSAAIYVRSAKKVFVTLAEGTENTLANGGSYIALDDNNIDAVIFSKEDLTLNGSGNLTITAVAGHGIVCKDDLAITGGNYEITAEKHGIEGKDSVRIADGTFTITSGKDGIHVENEDNEEEGYLYIENGTFTITSEEDGVSAGSYLLIEEGTYQILAGGGSGNGRSHSESWGFDPRQSQNSTQEDSVSTKGMKAAGSLTVNGGTFTINAADDAVHSNGDLTVNGGVFQVSTGDNGFHADNALTITAGTITIDKSYEGIEGLTIEIQGGYIDLTASDDGLNAAGGNDGSGSMFTATEGIYIHISGGEIHINASGDGIDSNGDLVVSGGETYVSGPTDNGNGALDYDGSAEISGGILIATGSSGMAQNFGSSSTQGTIMVNIVGVAGSVISLRDSSGQVLASWTAEKAYSNVVISCPGLAVGETYTLQAGDSSTEITMGSLVYGGSGSMMGGGPGGMMGGGPGGPRR